MSFQWSSSTRQLDIADFSDSDDDSSEAGVATRQAASASSIAVDAVDEGDLKFVESPFTIAQRRAAQRNRQGHKPGVPSHGKQGSSLAKKSGPPPPVATAYRQPTKTTTTTTLPPPFHPAVNGHSSPSSSTSAQSISLATLSAPSSSSPPTSVEPSTPAPYSTRGPAPAHRAQKERPGLLSARVACQMGAASKRVAPGQTTLCFGQRFPQNEQQQTANGGAVGELHATARQDSAGVYDGTSSTRPRDASGLSSPPMLQDQRPTSLDSFDALFCDADSLQIWKDVVTPPLEETDEAQHGEGRRDSRSREASYMRSHLSPGERQRRDFQQAQQEDHAQQHWRRDVPQMHRGAQLNHGRQSQRPSAPQPAVETTLSHNDADDGEDDTFAFHPDRPSAATVSSSSALYHHDAAPHPQQQQVDPSAAPWASSPLYANSTAVDTYEQEAAHQAGLLHPYPSQFEHDGRHPSSASSPHSWHVYQDDNESALYPPGPFISSSPPAGSGRQKLSQFAFDSNASTAEPRHSRPLYSLPSIDPAQTALRPPRGSQKNPYTNIFGVEEPSSFLTGRQRQQQRFSLAGSSNGNSGSRFRTPGAGLPASARRATVKRFDIPYLGSSSLSARARFATVDPEIVGGTSVDAEEVGQQDVTAQQPHRYALKRLPPDVSVEVHEWEEEDDQQSEGRGEGEGRKTKKRLTLFKPSAPREGM